MKFNKLMDNKSLDFKVQAFSSNYEENINVRDTFYLEFIKTTNGGYFYNNSLLVFGFAEYEENQWNSVYMNTILNDNYQKLVGELYFFAQDIFGNPFAFRGKEVVFLNLESAEIEVIANNFNDWLDELNNDIDFYTGKSLALELNTIQRTQLTNNKRLSPKYPFILGGEYMLDNLVLKSYKENIIYNAEIANQVYNLPEGSEIKIKIDNV